MITHTIDSYRIPFIPSQNNIVWGYNHKFVNVTKPRTYVKGYTNHYICIKFKSSKLKNERRNVKKVQIPNQVIVHIFNEV